MSFTEKCYPYDKEIVIGDEDNYLKLSITSRDKEVPNVDISSSNSKYSTVAVPLTLFSECYDLCLTSNTFELKELEESTTITRKGMRWEVTQSWEGEEVVTTISHKDMLKLLQYCSRYFQIKGTYLKAQPLYKKVYKVILSVYNLPRKIVGW